MDSATPGLVVLSGRHEEQGSKQQPPMASTAALASRFLPWLPLVLDCDLEV